MLAAKLSLILLLTTLCLAGCAFSARGETLGPVVVGSASTPEQALVGRITVLALQSAGYQVQDHSDLGDADDVRQALETRAIDICWEYTGDTWTQHLEHDLPLRDPQDVLEKVREEDARRGITWLAASPMQRQVGMALRAQDERTAEVADLSGLAMHLTRVDPTLTFCVPADYYDKVYGTRGLETVYGLQFPREQVHVMPLEEAYAALANGVCDCALAFSNDARLQAANLRFLEDDQRFFPISGFAVAVRTSVLRDYPGLERELVQVGALLTSDALTELSLQVAVKGRSVDEVARRFLKEQAAAARDE